MKITACSIVKNEEKNIGRSIESYKSTVDEIIIVDTGSTDNTVEICEKYGAKVLHFKWNDNFSDAKNLAIEHATGDWIIFLDADEWFVPALKRSNVMNIVRQAGHVAEGFIFTMKQIDHSKKEECFVTDGVTRIFRNLPDIRYKGSIHERIKRGDRELILARCPDLFIYHSGYSSELLEQKAKRNLDLLNNVYKNGEKDTILYYFLLRENYSSHNYKDALKFVGLFQQQDDVEHIIKNYSSAICFYEYAYGVMKNVPDEVRREEIMNLLNKAYEKYPEVPTHSYLLGREAMDNNLDEEAKIWLEKALELNENYSGTFSNSFPSYISDTYFRLGLINQLKGKQEAALEYYVYSLKYAVVKKYAPIIQNTLSIIGKENEKEIIVFLNSILDIRKKEVLEEILSVLRSTRLHKAFLYYAVKYNREFDGQNENTYIAMILTGQAEWAVGTAIKGSLNYKSDYNTGDQIYNGCGDSPEKYNWHLDYALMGILYCKDIELFERYKSYFDDTTKEIIVAYISGNKITNLTNEILELHNKIFLLIFNIIPEKELAAFRSII